MGLMSRKNQLWLLIILSAATAMSQYAIQGALIAPGSTQALPPAFWTIDIVLWSIRALVESLVIIYLFSTTPQTRTQGVMIAILEVALVALITLTIGPALLAARTGELPGYILGVFPWEYGLAAYTSLMMGSAGYAYRVQSSDSVSLSEVALLQSEIAQLRDELAHTHTQYAGAQSEIEAARAAVQTVSTFAALSSQLQVKWIVQNRNGNDPKNIDLARMFDVDPSTISRWINNK